MRVMAILMRWLLLLMGVLSIAAAVRQDVARPPLLFWVGAVLLLLYTHSNDPEKSNDG